MDFISQYIIAQSGTQVPIRYTRWAAIHLLATTAGLKVYVDHYHFKIRPSIYLCFVGVPDTKKTTAKDACRDMFIKAYPEFPVGASVTTREKIAEQLSSDKAERFYYNENRIPVPYKPLAFFVNELSNFMSNNIRGMIEFLTDIFDQPKWSASTLKHGLHEITNPCLSLLACTHPNYIISDFKASIAGGGFLRRMLLIYETVILERLTFPEKTEESKLAYAWCLDHLKKLELVAGPMTWEDDARVWFNAWNKKYVSSDDPLFSHYHSSKDILAQKVAICLALAQPEPKLVFTTELLQTAIAFLEANEDNLPLLSVAAGRNMLAVPTQKLLSQLRAIGGFMPEKLWHQLAAREVNEMEYASIKRYLKDTDQVIEFPMTVKSGDKMILTIALPEVMTKLKEEGRLT